MLEQCGLPLHLHENPDTHISTLKNWKFVALAGSSGGIEDIGLRIAHERVFDFIGPRVLRGVLSAPTLLRGIEEFSNLAKVESSGMRIRLFCHGRAAHLILKKSFEMDTPGFRQTEWLGVMVLTKEVGSEGLTTADRPA